MPAVIPIKGATRFTINLDPSVWIFDSRKIDLDAYLHSGEVIPVKEREVGGSYAVPFAPFLEHAEPLPEASEVICHLNNQSSVSLSLNEASASYLAFSKQGKPLKEDGPIHLYFGPDQYQRSPIKGIVAFEVKV